MIDLNILEPETKKFIESVNSQSARPLYKLSIAEARGVLDSLQANNTKTFPVQIEDKIIPCKDEQISIRIVRPNDIYIKLPIVIYFHGGGWILGNKHTHDRLIRELAHLSNAAIVFVEYTPSPEARYPKAIEQAYEVTKYLAINGEQLNLDPSRLAVAGDSVGGNMAAVIAMLAKERGTPHICQQILFYPVTDSGLNTDSYAKYKEGPWLTKEAMEWFWNAYEPDPQARKQSTISPLQASVEQLRDLPKTLIITAENDVLRDEGEEYAHKLMAAGVSVTAVRFLGTIHDFVMLNALSDTPATQGALSLASATLRDAFEK